MSNDNETKRPEENMPENTPAEGAAPEQANDRYLFLRRVDVKLKPGYVLRKVGQAYMVMPTGPRMKEYQGMITLNETGAFLFKEVQKPDASQASLVQACIDEYGATPEEALAAADSFINQCADCGLFEFEVKIYDTVEQREVTEDELRKE